MHNASLLRAEQQLILTSTRRVDIHCREHAALGDFTVELQLGVTGALELLEDDGVACGTGLHHRSGDDGEAATFFDVSGSTQEALRWVQSVGVHTTGEDSSRCRRRVIVRTAKAGNGVQQYDDVLPLFHQTLCTLNSQLGHCRVI